MEEIGSDSDLLTTEKIGDCDIATAPLNQCLDVICRWIEAGERARVFACANPHSLAMAENDPEFKAAIGTADLVTPDGAGIVLASKILGGKIRGRVTGSDIFLGLSRLLNKRGDKMFGYFFLGSTEATLATIREKLSIDFPNIRFAGSFSPPFREEFDAEESRKMVAVVNEAKADVLWVGMTAPKQEKWIFQHKDELDVRFIGAVGAVFDFYTGNVKRSHPVFQRLGLEWLPRLIRNPRRLWRRMGVSAPMFMWYVVREKLRGKRNEAI